MKKYFLLSAAVISFVSIIHANPITPKAFTQHGKEFMKRSVALWTETADKVKNHKTKLCDALHTMYNEGIESLIHNEEVLSEANKVYSANFNFLDFITEPETRRMDYLISEHKDSVPVFLSILCVAGYLVQTEEQYGEFRGLLFF